MEGERGKQNNKWEMMMNFEENHSTTTPTSSLSFENSNVSNGSNSSQEMADDASSSSSFSSAGSPSMGSMYDLSELMMQLPIKRGLSKYYQGKSQSFTCMSRVRSIEDLAKKERPIKKKTMLMKASKSCAGGLDNFKQFTQPKASISKKAASRGSLLTLTFPNRMGGFVSTCSRPPLIPVAKTVGGC